MKSGNISTDEGKIKQIKSKVVHENLKSNFILKAIFGYIKNNKGLEIMKCNKKIQRNNCGSILI